MFLATQAAFKSIEGDLNPELKLRRDAQFKDYDRSGNDESEFKSRRGSKSEDTNRKFEQDFKQN